MPRQLRVLAALLLVATSLRGQESLPVTSTARAATMDWLRNLPLDFLEDYFILEPGIGPALGGFSVRGGQPRSVATYLDGMPINAGFRGTGQGGEFPTLLGATGSRLQLPVRGVSQAALTTGVPGAAFGDGQSGVLTLTTSKGTGRLSAGADVATDELWGADNSLGLNRLQASIAGGLGPRVGVSLAGTLAGQFSAAFGPGQRDVPIYLASGVDTTVALPTAIGDPLADTTFVDVLRFRENDGLQVPSSVTSNYQVVGRMDIAISPRTNATFSAAASQDQRRRFDYLNLYNPAQLGATRAASHALTLSVTHDFGASGGRIRALELALSAQGDRFESGPLSAQGESDSRDPTGGFLIAPLDFEFGFEDFAVNEELVTNVLRNRSGTRRSPYDLENPAQFSLVELFRNNAYGVRGFSDRGGPTGRLALMDEDRLVGRIALDWALDGRHTLRVGGEFVEYDLANYSHELTSQAFSDVYIEHPARQAGFLEDRIALGDVSLTAGLRYDRFTTGASRMAGVPRISSNPAFDPANPRALMTPDASHAALSPRLQFGYRMTPRTDLRAGIGRQVQMPDFGLSLAGITTDLSVTNTTQVFGTDLDYARTVLAEIGLTHRFFPSTSLDVSAYDRQLRGQVAVRQESVFDSLSGGNRGLLYFRSVGDGSVLGVDIRLEQRLGPYFQTFMGYAYQDATVPGNVAASWGRTHTLAGALGGHLPDGWREGTLLGALLENGGVWGTFRWASGTRYTACPVEIGNEGVLSGQSCARGFQGELNGQRLPITKQFDLKLARNFAVGGTRVSGYVDARNLFNFDNTSAVFAATGSRESPVLEARAWLGDSAGYALEASANGVSLGDGSIDLRFGGSGAAGCGNWVDEASRPSSPNCVYLVRAERRFGDADGVFNVAEQRRASSALYNALDGGHLRSGPGRFIRLGATVEF